MVVAWTIGVIPTSKSPAGHPLLLVGLPTIALAMVLHIKKRGENAVKNGKRDGEIAGQREG